MCKSKVQFQKAYSLSELFSDYGDKAKCEQALFAWKWPNGFVCPECGSKKYCQLKCRKLFQCNHCHHQTSLISDTIFASTKLPLNLWFLAIHLILQSKTGCSAMSLMRQLGVSYNTAWKVKHKIMQVMKEHDNESPLSGIVQIDDVYWGGEQHGGKRGRGSSNKTPFVAAVQVSDKGYPQAMTMNVVKGFRLAEIKKWAQSHLSRGTTVVSDGLGCFKAVTQADCQHNPKVTGGGHQSVEIEAFIWVNTMILESAVNRAFEL